ncbi:putative Ni/Fe-hydrogenase 2 b-type cytochrome subunit [mine drainage metagenome]|uniref:Putative Ni/Fe-hydrogenase 2 b-type cytochrome subunit n=1 Tax=mine drainage metagenome TaxID=410659 RepID=A0A1J5R480_9ZZZZ
MSKHAPLGGSLITRTTVIAAVLFVLSMVLLAVRFLKGLGAVANINNGYPWGIWVAYDVVIGTAFACGGYAMALLVYILNKGKYHPLVRPALLASMFGYSLGGFSVIFDLGRYWNFWHIMTPGYANPNSVMFEVALCVACYCVVLWIEFTPSFAEKWGGPALKRRLNNVLFVFIALGCLLPTMHQSSLGTLLVVFGQLIHPLWQTRLLPLLFLMSALAMGFSIVIFEATLVTSAYKRPSEARILAFVTRYIVVLMSAYLLLRWGDLAYEGKLGLVFSSGGLSLMFWLENLLFATPIVLMLPKANRVNERLQFLSAVSMLLGGGLYRIDAYLVAYGRPGWHYFPSVGELLVTLGIIALEVLAYIVFVKRLPVLHPVHAAGPTHAVERAPAALTTE